MNRSAAGFAVAIVLGGVLLVYLYVQPFPSSTTRITTQGTSVTLTQSTSQSAGWLTYHLDNSRSGAEPNINFTSVHFNWRSVHLDGSVYAEPLVFDGAVYVATENNSVYALSASTGDVIWRVNLGAPVPRSVLPCGNIDLTGITSTPVIDTASRLLFAVAYLNPPHHVLFALGVDDGKVHFQQSADASGMDPLVQQQRAALSLANGYVYIPYGGLFGDCGEYHGWVVGIRADGSGGTTSIQLTTDRAGGIWAPSGAVVDSSGNLFVTTGNGASSSEFDHGNSVVKLSPSLRELDFFAPSNWAQLNERDADLGSAGPALLGSNMLFQVGKDGVGYLLNATHLGGVGGQLFSQKVCGGAFGGLAYAPPYVFVPCTDGLTAVRVSGASFQVAWRSSPFFAGPPVVTGHVVWTVDTSGGVVHVFGLDGRAIFSYAVGNVEHFTTPSGGYGSVFVATGDQLVSFALH